MTRITLILKFLGLSAFWGLVLGAGLGGGIGVLLGIISLWVPAILYFGLIFGVGGIISGVLLGGINGIIQGLIAATFYYPKDRKIGFRITALTVSIIVTFCLSLYGYWSILNYYSVVHYVEFWVALIPTLISVAAVIYASHRVSNWYTASVQSIQELPQKTEF